MTEVPDEAWDEWYAEKQRRNYRMELMAHPHPSDPDHPDPADYGLEEDDE